MPRAVGDTNHTLYLELAERLPETIIMKRSRQNGRPSSAASDMAVRKSLDAHSGAMTLALTARPATAEWDTHDALSPTQHGSLESEGKKLERNFMQKLSGHYKQLAVELRMPAPPCHTLGPHAAHKYAEEVIEAAARIRARTKDLAQEYIREIRSALRLVGPSLPVAARVIEGAVKGLVVALDMSLSAGWHQAEELEGQVTKLKEESMEAKLVLDELQNLKRENNHLQESCHGKESRLKDIEGDLHRKIEELKQEIERLSPDQSDLEGVAGLMGEYNALMVEMQEETRMQTIILDNITEYTKNVVGDVTSTPEERQRINNGRVIELANGDLCLRPYDVENQETQVCESDLNSIDPDAPVRLRTAGVRQLMTVFSHENTPVMEIRELDAEIDRIYDGKIRADEVADAAQLERRELADFVVEFYLDSFQSVHKAQEKFCSILRCLQSADRNDLQVPLKVLLFQRFLEFCEYDESLPLTVLNVVLQAKRFARQLMGVRNKPSDREKEARDRYAAGARNASVRSRDGSAFDIETAAMVKEPQLGVALAYEAAMKALPQQRMPAMSAFFAGLSSRAEIENSKNGQVMVSGQVLERDLLVLLQLLHGRLQQEGARLLLDLVQRIENHEKASVEEFRESVRDAKVQAIDDSVWLKKLQDPDTPGQLNGKLMMDLLGGGGSARIPAVTISESGFMAAVTEAVAEDFHDRLQHIHELWKRRCRETHSSNGSLCYADFESVVRSEDSNMPKPMLHAAYLTTVEMSRGCSQLNGDPCLPVGTMEPLRQASFETIDRKAVHLMGDKLLLSSIGDGSHTGDVSHTGTKFVVYSRTSSFFAVPTLPGADNMLFVEDAGYLKSANGMWTKVDETGSLIASATADLKVSFHLGEYGGEVVTFPLFAKAALKCGLFLKDFSSQDASAAGKQAEATGMQHRIPQGLAGTGGLNKRGATPKSSPKR
jgi:hypothetical protein